MKKICFSIIAVLLLFSASSCINDLRVESIDPNQSSKLDIDGTFAKIYATLGLTGQQGPSGMGDVADIDEGTSAFYRMMHALNEYPADMVYWIWPDVGVDDVRNATWNSSNALVKGFYSRLYFDITLCNLFLDETEEMQSEDGMVVKRAEVRFIRALNYYYLLDMYGNVPYVVESGIKDKPKQKSRKEIFEFVEDELIMAEKEMAEAGQRVSYYRVDKAAAWLLLSRLYLNSAVYLGKTDAECVEYYDKAAEFAYKVINSPYDLASKYSYLFMGDNDIRSGVNDAHKEIILPIAQDGAMIRSYGGTMYLIAATHTEGLSEWGVTESWKCIRSRKPLVQLFFPDLKRNYAIEPGDSGLVTRNKELMAQIEELQYKGDYPELTQQANDDRALFCNYRVYNDTMVYVCNFGAKNAADEFKSGWSIAKFTNLYADKGMKPTDSQWPDADIPFMRKAEAYLNYAEAVLRGGKSQGMTVDDAVNKLRERAHAKELTGVTLDDILDERGREFFCEGYRRSDLIRYNKFGGETGYTWEWKGGAQLGKNIDAFRNLYPIPASECTVNENITQNEGY